MSSSRACRPMCSNPSQSRKQSLRIAAIDPLQFVGSEIARLQTLQMSLDAVSGRINVITSEYDLRPTHDHFQACHLDRVCGLRGVVIEPPQVVEPGVRFRRL